MTPGAALIVTPLGEAALRFVLPADVDRAATRAALAALPGVRDVVLAEAHGAVYFEGAPTAEGLAAAVVLRGAAALAGRLHTLRARYDGPDLGRVAAWAGVSPEEVVRLHAAATYEVRYLGFLPGFAYLATVDARIAAPRLPAPRPRVPKGAVGIAGPRTGVYPAASPGGWNLVATALDFDAFDPRVGATLLPGDRVRFEPA